MEFSRQEHWSEWPPVLLLEDPPPGDLPNLSLMSPAVPGQLFTTSFTREAVQRVAKCVDSEAGGLGPSQEPGMY